jgi:hypothetical protein
MKSAEMTSLAASKTCPATLLYERRRVLRNKVIEFE